MSTHDPRPEAHSVRIAELRQQRTDLDAATQAVKDTRKALQDAIVRHLAERSAPPGQISDHTPYDRNHVGAIGRAAGVKPLRVKGQPAEVPNYRPEVVAAALEELDRLTADHQKALDEESARHGALQAAATQDYVDGRLTAQSLSDATKFDRNTIMRWGREARKKGAGDAP
ncbi:hypothetical protein [Streptomyces sp. KAU_LT]|uniref:hypothetical protein n=1 Tax=Streptomyces sp. KAU_LT TaxID=3046669 RepID=UPI0024B67DF4|nr:hypothetical protein [Streptomyces sp. KAU_LT]MDI9836254.1 hypothetical protein [Streptomyces sp. KAU_LT]